MSSLSPERPHRRRSQCRRSGVSARRGTQFLLLFGRTRLFDDATLKSLYPTHEAFVTKFAAAAAALERQGYWLEAEADAARQAAAASNVGR